MRYFHEPTRLSSLHRMLLPVIFGELAELPEDRKRVFDLGAGNGAIAHELAKNGWSVTGVDPSEVAAKRWRESDVEADLHIGSADEPLSARFGQFPVLVSLEVVEHVYDPDRFASTVRNLLEPGGLAVISTPYHGYWKNLAISLIGAWDKHANPLRLHGHIKFWSPNTIYKLLKRNGLEPERTHRVGRIKALAKSMVVVARKDEEGNADQDH